MAHDRPGYVEERAKMFESWVYTAKVGWLLTLLLDVIRVDLAHKECRAMNDFSSASAIVTALMSPKVAMLVLACEEQTTQIINTLNRDLSQSSGAYYDTLRQTGTKELIPWLGIISPPCTVCLTSISLAPSTFADPHLSTLNSTFAHSNPIIEVDDGLHHLIDFKLCSELAGQIDSIAQYRAPIISKIRPDILEYVEYHLQSGLALKDLHAAAVVTGGGGLRLVSGARTHSGKELTPRRLTTPSRTIAKRETRKSSLGGPRESELWMSRPPASHPSHPSRGRVQMTQDQRRGGDGGDTARRRRGALALSLPLREKHTTSSTRTRGERMARRQREEKARPRPGRKESTMMRRDEEDMAQWREDMGQWRNDMERWREDNARQVDLGGATVLHEDVSMQRRRKGLMSRLFREKIVMVC